MLCIVGQLPANAKVGRSSIGDEAVGLRDACKGSEWAGCSGAMYCGFDRIVA